MRATTILVVDDDKHQRELLLDYLEAQGHRVILGFDGQMAVALARAHQPNLIIMDVDMPHFNGLQALEVLRSEEATSQIPVIMLSAVTSDRVFPVIQSMKNVIHIKKPLNLEDLNSEMQLFLPAPPAA